MPGKLLRRKPRPLKDGSDGIPVDPRLSDLAVPVDLAEARTGGDLSHFKPLTQGSNWTGGNMGSPGNSNLSSLPCLIGLRTPQGEHRSFRNPGKIIDHEGGELGAA